MTAVARSYFPLEVDTESLPSQPVALDDPVPSDSTLAVFEPQFCRTPPHQIESQVRRTLMSQPELRFSSLVVRRLSNGVCLEGVLETAADAPDVNELAREVAGVECVINRLLVQKPSPPVRRRH